MIAKPFRLPVSFVFVALVAACGGDGGGAGVTADAGEDALVDGAGDTGVVTQYPSDGVLVRFDLEEASTEHFFAFPWPSDLRLLDEGGPDLTAFPSQSAVGNLLRDFTRLAEQRVRGFSNVQTVYFAFEEALDPATLPADPDASLSLSASVYLLDIDPSSPWYGRHHPIDVVYRAESAVYWDDFTLVLQPLYGFPLRAATRYAAIVTTDVLGEDGRPVIGPPAFRGLFDGTADAEVAAHYVPLLDAIDDLGIDPNVVSAATVFTTSDPTADLLNLRAWLHANTPTPEAENVSLTSDGFAYDLYEGTYASLEMQDGTPPFRRFGEGTVTLDENGEPLTQVPADLRFALMIPAGDAPDGAWPVLIYLHGTGGDYLSFSRNNVVGEMARRGIAIIGVDQPLHGTRNPTEQSPLDLVINLSVGNLIGGAGLLAQGAADMLQVTRLLRNGVTIPAEVSATGEAIVIDTERIAFMGHSQGAQVGPLFLAAEPDVVAGVLSEGGGGAAISAILRKDNDIDIERIIGLALGIDGVNETLEIYHPVMGCIAQPLFDFVDPLSFARHIVLEPRHGRSHNFLMTIGYQDKATPPPGIEALASAAGLPPAQPAVREIPSMTIQGIVPVRLPATENLPEFDGARSTGALIAFEGRNHFVVSSDAGAQFQVYEFIATALQGRAFVFPPELRD